MGKHSSKFTRRHPRAMIAGVAVVGLATSLLVPVLIADPVGATTGSTLPGGTSISVNVTSPTEGQTFDAGASVTVSGTATIGAPPATVPAALVTAVDNSGSTQDPGGSSCGGNVNGDATTNDVLDCELNAAIKLNQTAIGLGTIGTVGAVVFADPAVTVDVDPTAGDQLTTTPTADKNAANGRDIEEAFASVKRTANGGIGKFTAKVDGSATNFTDAITKAGTVLNAAPAGSRKLFVMMSDGFATASSGSTKAAIQALPAGTVINTFAVGSGSACGSATDPKQQSLAYIAAMTNGTCTAVLDPTNLPSVLPNAIASRLTALALTVDGGAATAITNVTPSLPVNGAASVDYTVATASLAPGTHKLCVTATGTDPMSGTVSECKNVVVNRYIVNVTAQDKTRTYGTANPPLDATVTGLQPGDSLTSGPSCTTTATATSPISSATNTYSISCSATADPAKYEVRTTDGVLTITPASSTVNGPNLTKTYGDPDPSFAPTSASGGAPVPATAACAAPSTYSGDVGTYTLTCTGPAAEGNYTYTYTNGSLKVDPKASVITGPSVSKTYGDPDPSFAPTASVGPVPSGASCAPPTTYTGDVGTYVLTCTGPASQGNYSYTYRPGSLTVNPKAAVISCATLTKTYGDADPVFTPMASGGAPVPATAACTLPTSYAGNVGTYTVTATGPATAGNYSYTYVDGSLTVNPKASVVSCPTVSKTYGDADPSFAPSASAGAPVPATATCTLPSTYVGNVGTYTLTAAGPATAGNYSFTYANGTLTVNAKAAVVTGPNVTKTYGDPDPSFAPTASEGGVPAGATCAPPSTYVGNVGTYTLTCTGPATAGNYSYTYVNGSLTVNPKPSVVTCPTVSKTYGDADPSFAPSASAGAPVPGGATCSLPTSYAGNVGTYTLTAAGPATAGNYSYTYVNGSLTVNAKPSVVTCPTVSKTYGDADPSFAPTASEGGVPAGATCTAPNPHANVGTYTLTAAGPATAGNYSYTYRDGSLTVNPRRVTVTAQDAVKVYGAADPAFTPSTSGLVNGDPLPATVTCTAANPHVNVGTYDITCAGPATSGNYTFTYVNPATLTVLKASPKVSTTPSGATPSGGNASDTATISNTGVATGSVTFQLFGPGDTTCQTPIATRTGALSGNVASSGNVPVTAGPGTYRWIATYPGDANNNSGVSGCDEELFQVVPQTLTGHAYGIAGNATLAGSSLLAVRPTPDTGAVRTTASNSYEPPCVATISGLVGVQAVCAALTVRQGPPSSSTAVASVAAAQIPISTLPTITVRGVRSDSTTSCTGSVGNTTIDYLAVGSTVVISKPVVVKPNTIVNVGVVRLVLNEQKAFTTPDNGLTVNAIHITVNAVNVAKTDIVIASSESDISGCP